VSRPNPKSEWVNRDVPELRIVDQELWEQVKARQAEMAIGPIKRDMSRLASRRRPKYLLAGLLKCDCCGSAYTLVSKDLLGCAKARNKGTCQNRLNIRVDTLEASVVRGLRTHLMDRTLFESFCEEFTREVNRARISKRADQAAWQSELRRIDRDLNKLLSALKAGGPMETIVADIKRLESRKTELSRLLASAEEPPPLLHPNMSEIYRQRVAALEEGLRDPEARQKAMERLRQLVNQVRLVNSRAILTP
jgi:hypothetical protein